MQLPLLGGFETPAGVNVLTAAPSTLMTIIEQHNTMLRPRFAPKIEQLFDLTMVGSGCSLLVVVVCWIICLLC